MSNFRGFCIAALFPLFFGAPDACAQAGRWGVAPPPSASEREPRSWERDEPAQSRSLDSAPRPSGVTPWTAPVQGDSAASRCDHFREQMEEAIRAEMRGADRANERREIYQARQRAGC